MTAIPPHDIAVSFCIATLNRARFIGDTIRSILSQANDRVEIVVVDGASTDDTGEVVREYADRWPNIRYHRQRENMGVDRDFNKAVELARGEYCWLMSDDDLLRPGALATVLGEIRHGYSLLIANAEVRNSDLSRLLEERRLPIRENRAYAPCEFETMFADTASHLSFIGCVIIRRDLWMQREKEVYFGTVFIHVGVIFQCPLPGEALAIAEPLVSIRYGNALWTPRGFEIWMFKWPSLLWSFPGITDGAKAKVFPREPWRRPDFLVMHRAMGSYTLREYNRMIAPMSLGWLERSLFWLIAASPGSLWNLLVLSYLRLRPGASRIAIQDMKNSRYHYRTMLRKLFG